MKQPKKVWYGDFENGYDLLTVRDIWVRDNSKYVVAEGRTDEDSYYTVCIDVGNHEVYPANSVVNKKMCQINRQIKQHKSRKKFAEKFLEEYWMEFSSTSRED